MTELTLDAILSGDEESQAEEQPQAETMTSEESESAESQNGTDENQGEDQEESAEPTADKSESTADSKEAEEEKDWKFAALKDERRKRQELERELEELRKPKEEAKAPDVLDDPEGYQSFQESQLDAKVNNVKAEMSQFYAEKEYGKEKVTAAFEKFSEMVKDNPSLYQKAVSSVSPYHEIVEIVSKAEKFEQLQNVDEYEAKLRAEIESKIREEYEGKYSKSQAKRESVTPSLNSQKSASGGNATADLSLENILGR
jgi:hypothetical protein